MTDVHPRQPPLWSRGPDDAEDETTGVWWVFGDCTVLPPTQGVTSGRDDSVTCVDGDSLAGDHTNASAASDQEDASDLGVSSTAAGTHHHPASLSGGEDRVAETAGDDVSEYRMPPHGWPEEGRPGALGVADTAAIDAFLDVASEADADVARPGWRERRELRRRARKSSRRARATSTRFGLIRLFVVLTVVGVVAAALVWHERRLNALEGVVAPTIDHVAEHVQGAPGTRLITLTTTEGVAILVFVDDEGRAYLYGGVLPVLTGERTYQLWGATDSTRVSLALLGAAPDVEAFRLPESVGSLAITVGQHEGGEASSAAQSIAFGYVSD